MTSESADPRPDHSGGKEPAQPRAYAPSAPPPVRRGPIGAAMGMEAVVFAAIAWAVWTSLIKPGEAALATLIASMVGRSVNDRIAPSLPGLRPPGAHGFWLRFFRPTLTAVSTAAAAVLVWRLSPLLAIVTGAMAVAVSAWSALLALRLRYTIGAGARLRDTPVFSRTLVPLLNQAMRDLDDGQMGAAQEEIRQLREDPGNTALPGVAAAVAMQRGNWAMAQGDFTLAETCLRDAVAYFRSVKRPNRSAAGEAITALGQLLAQTGRRDEARAHLKLATEVAGGRMFRLTRLQIEATHAIIAAGEDDWPAVRRHAEETRRLADKWQIPSYRAEGCDLLALLAADEGDHAAAVALLGEADAALVAEPRPYARIIHAARAATVLQEIGRNRAALDRYLTMMEGLADLRRGWGSRDAQNHLVEGFADHELSALRLASGLATDGDEAAPRAFARLLAFAERTELRRMLLSDLTEAGPDRTGQEITRLLAEISSYEGTTAASGARPDLMKVHDRDTAAYDRLETLVSQRFRFAIEGTLARPLPEGSVTGSHTLQVRLFESEDGEMTIAGLWTHADGTQKPYVHEAEGLTRTMLHNLVGHVPLPPRAETAPPDLPSGYRGAQQDWRDTYRYWHFASPSPQRWADLARLLLPPSLLALLAATDAEGNVPYLLVVPDASLWRVPWAALVVTDRPAADPHLLDRAVVTMLPCLSLLDRRPERPPSHRENGAYYFRDVDRGGLDIEEAALAAAFAGRVRPLESPADLLAVLGAPTELDLLAVSVHGTGRPGLAHSLFLDAGTELSAARMLTLTFPRLLMINACMSAEMDTRRGTDPLAIPTVALCRGARTVIGGIFPLPDGPATIRPEYDYSTALILADLYARLSEGAAPARALRDAQRAWIADRPAAVPWLWAGLVAIGASTITPGKDEHDGRPNS